MYFNYVINEYNALLREEIKKIKIKTLAKLCFYIYIYIHLHFLHFFKAMPNLNEDSVFCYYNIIYI